MTGIRKYWIVATFGTALCLVGVIHGYLADFPPIANKYGAVSVALTFGMLFLSRGTAFRLLDAPVTFTTSVYPVEQQLHTAISDLNARRPAPAAVVNTLIDCLLAAESQAEELLVRGERRSADTIFGLIRRTLDDLDDSKRTLVETGFVAKNALRAAQRNREALATLLDSNRKESLPIALLSFVATLCAGLGDSLVRIF